tara:strand:+ start:1229 stop:1411 length:183 start_codon:yes stop_codon:yes gene_type:complete
MYHKINFKALLGMLASFYVAYLTAAGIMQKIIPFSGELNEMAFFILNLFMGSLCLMCIKK